MTVPSACRLIDVDVERAAAGWRELGGDFGRFAAERVERFVALDIPPPWPQRPNRGMAILPFFLIGILLRGRLLVGQVRALWRRSPAHPGDRR